MVLRMGVERLEGKDYIINHCQERLSEVVTSKLSLGSPM